MLFGYILLEAFLIAGCFNRSLTDSNEDFKEIRQQLTYKALNSILGRLARNQQERMKSAKEDITSNDPANRLPEYTEAIEADNILDRSSRHLALQKHVPICHLERKIKRLNTIEYEYRPAYYEEVICGLPDYARESNEICSSLGFSCVQWNKTIHLTRRRYSSDCWETKALVIPAGCECMWPVHRLGDMKLHV